MSEPVTALGGARYEGYATVEECAPRGMISLRADLSDAAVAKALKTVTGLSVPDVRAIGVNDALALAWMSPDEALILCPYADVADTLVRLNKALGKTHALAVDVSDARALFRVSGGGAREVLAKLAPVDMSPDAFGPGEVRRSRIAQVAAAFWLDASGDFHVVCFRSVAQYVFDCLADSAAPGAEAGVFHAG